MKTGWIVAAGLIIGLAGCSSDTDDSSVGPTLDVATTPDIPDAGGTGGDTDGTDAPDVMTDGGDAADVMADTLEDTAEDAGSDTDGTDGPDVADASVDVEDTDGTDAADVMTDTGTLPDTSQLPDAAMDVADTAAPMDTAVPMDTADAGNDTQLTGCETHADCADDDLCTVELCVDGTCTSEDVVCNDGSNCTSDSCVAPTGCVHTFQGGPGCVQTTSLFAADFDNGTLSQMTIIDDAANVPETELPIVWVPDPSKRHSGAGALYFGRPGPYDYDNGRVVAATAQSPVLNVPTNKPTQLDFWMWMDVEPGAWWDVLTVSVAVEGGATVPVWAKSDSNVVMKQWLPVNIDLTAFGGKAVRVNISFHSIEASYNETTGVFIDSIGVRHSAVAKSCTTDLQCSDGIGCTVDTCVDGACVYETGDNCCLTAADCQDGDACTIELCSVGECVYYDVPDPTCCNTTADCDDSNVCTDDLCAPNNRCEHSISDAPGCCTTTSQCNDQDTCTKDACVDFICQNVNTCCQSDAECDDGDDVCTNDTCVNGACKFSYNPIPGCCTPVLFSDDFEGGGDNWTVTGGGGGCDWQVYNGQSKSPSNAMWYGDPSTGDYDCGDTSGTVTSDTISLPDKDGLSLELDIWYDTESLDSYDVTTISIIDGGSASTLYTKTSLPSTESTWHHLKKSLNAFKGKDIKIQFKFETVDSTFNYYPGVYIDNVQITDPCE